jgi:hypothetical protein
MFRETLVEDHIPQGAWLLQCLQQKFPIVAAFWYHSEELNGWRLIFISPYVQQRPRDAYRQLVYCLYDLSKYAAQMKPIARDRVSLLGPESLLFQHVKNEANTAGGFKIAGRPPQNTWLNDDVYLYTI